MAHYYRHEDFMNYTPRHIMNNRINAILYEGSDLNYQNNTGSTILHEAAYAGNIPGVRLLVEHGIDLNIKNNSGYTALHYATNKWRNKILNFLIKNGANLMACSHNGEIPLLRAKRHKNLMAFRYLAQLHNYTVTPAQSEADKLLFKDAKRKAHRKIDRWLSKGANHKMSDEYGTTPLDIVVKNGDIKCLRLFKNNNINLHQTNEIGENTLFLAVQHSTIECLNYLLENGAEIDYTDFKGQTVLHAAVYANNMKIVQHLIALGVDHSVKDTYGKTALDVAIDTSNKPMISLLRPVYEKEALSKLLVIKDNSDEHSNFIF